MDKRIRELIDFTKAKFGLDNYYLQRHQLDRSVDIFHNTIYTLCMEWFPNHITEQEDDDLNPEGAAVIEIDLHTHKYKSAIFVMGKTYTTNGNGITFVTFNKNDIIKWIEQETGLTYGRQFQLHKVEEGEFLFNECIDGVAVSPSGSIEIKCNHEGKLTFFAVHGSFPSKEIAREETYSLSLERIENLAKEQVKLVEFPSFEQKKLVPVYAVEEIYVTNDQTSTIPFEVIQDAGAYLKIEKTIYWDKSIHRPFNRKEINWTEEVTIEQAFLCEPSPDSFLITKEEREQCLAAVKDFLRQEYPTDTGKWKLKTLHRDKGYIHATVRANKQNNRVFQRKIDVIIDAKSLQVINFIDNKPMLEMFDQFQAPEKVTITKEEAYEKVKGLLEIKPYYVYDVEQKQYVLCGKIDCQYGVNASSGEVIALDDL